MNKIIKSTFITVMLLLQSHCWAIVKIVKTAWSNVYITNDTPLTLKAKTAVKGKTKQLTKGKDYEIWATEIGPWQRKIVFKFARTNLPTTFAKKTDFYFRTTVTPYDNNNRRIAKPITIYHLVKSNWKGVLLPPSFVRKKGIIELKKYKHGLYSLPWRVNGRFKNLTYTNHPVDVYFDSYLEFGRLFHDQEYIFSLKPFTKAMFDSNNNVLRVLTYNIWLRPLFFFEGQFERAKILPKSITGMFKNYKPDVVAFNEVFVGPEKWLGVSVYKTLKDGMRKQGYYYSTGVANSKLVGKTVNRQLKKTNSGVVIFSRWPIVKKAETVFEDCKGADCHAAKGIQYAQIIKNGKIYNIFATHLNAGHKEVMRKQLVDVNAFVKKQNISKKEPVIIMGDFNVNKTDKPWYKEMLEKTNTVHPHPKNEPQATNTKGWYLDYVLYDKDYQKPVTAFNRPLVYGMYIQKPWLVWEKSFIKQLKNIKTLFSKMQGVRDEAADHFPVFGYFKFAK